jgi:hypothetical protein
MPSFMCCTWSPTTIHGVLHYDFFWDVLPHTDRFKRTFTTEWAPLYAEGKQRVSDCRYDFTKGRDPSHPKVQCGFDTRPI